MRISDWSSDVCSSDLLVDAEGRVRAATLTEFDGYFLFEGVAYGRYTVRLDKASAAALRLDGAFAMSAAPGKATPRVRLGTLVLKPVRRDVAIRDEAPSAATVPVVHRGRGTVDWSG